MSLIPRASKGTDGQYSEPLVNGIVVGGTSKPMPIDFALTGHGLKGRVRLKFVV